MISTPKELAEHLHQNRQTAGALICAVTEDIDGATDAIMDILDQGYERSERINHQ